MPTQTIPVAQYTHTELVMAAWAMRLLCGTDQPPLSVDRSSDCAGNVAGDQPFRPERHGGGLLALSLIDWDTRLLPDQLTLPLLWLGLIANLDQTFTTLESAVVGAVAGYVSLWLVFHLFHLVTGKYGLGYGDFKLYAAFGAWLGWELLPQILLFASLSGTLLGTVLILLRHQSRQTPMPFGPHLAAAGCLALFCGTEINHWYLDLTMP